MRHGADNMSLRAARVGSSRRIYRSVLLGACLAVCLYSLAVGASAQASTGYVDGISDQSMPSWDGGFSGNYFASFFDSAWVNPAPHIAYARYVVQWNVIYKSTEKPYNEEPYVHYRQQFEEWVNDAAGMGLLLDIAVTEYPGTPYPSSSSEYKSRLKEVLNQANAQGHPISYLEPWNEPNGQGKETEIAAAHFANEGNVACKESPKCTVIAGNVEDGSSATKFLTTYRENLNFTPIDWGVHPYQSVEHRELKYYNYFLEGLPNKGSGDHVWFTEVAARRCTGTTENGEMGQAERAKWLVQTLMPSVEPEHVFYWEFLLKNRQQPSCSETDDALYVPSSDPNAPDAPRPAAAFIYGDSGIPWGYTGAATVSTTGPTSVLTASIYPGGSLAAEYYFEYGTTTLYGNYSSKGNAGSGTARVAASLPIGALAAGTTYHYRIFVKNAEGASTGSDETFTMPGPPGATTEPATEIQENQTTLRALVNPNGADTHYYFEYGTLSTYGSDAPAYPGADVGSAAGGQEVAATVQNLLPGTTYYFRVVATNWTNTSTGGARSFHTLGGRPSVLINGTLPEVFFRDPSGNLFVDDYGSNWTSYNLTAITGTQIAGDPFALLRNGLPEVFFRDPSGNLFVDDYGSNWTSYNLTAITGTQIAGDPTVIVRNSVPDIYYRDPSDDLIETTYVGGKWTSYDLTSITGIQIASDPFVVLRNGLPEVYFRSPNGDLLVDDYVSNWTSYDLTSITGIQIASDPFVVLRNGLPEVYFRSPNGDLLVDDYVSNWTSYDLTSITGIQIASDPFVVLRNGLPEVYFRSPNGDLLVDDYVSNWTSYDLTSTTGIKIASDPFVLIRNSLPEVYFGDPASNLFVDDYGSNWVGYNLTTLTGTQFGG